MMANQFGECSVPLEDAFKVTVVKEEEYQDEDFIDDKVQISETAVITEVHDNITYDKIKQYDISTILDNIKTELPLTERQCDMKHDNIKIEEGISADNIRIEFNNGLLHCEECQVYCEDYCTKCEMLVHILNKTVLISVDTKSQEELPDDNLEIQDNFGEFHVLALKSIPVRVRFGPFTGLNRTERSWNIKGGKFVLNNDKSKYLNWMQYVNPARNISEQNLRVFQYEYNLYYESTCQIEVGDELLVYFGEEYEDSLNRDVEMDFVPTTAHSFKDAFACTSCCLGFSSKLYLAKHKTICLENAGGEFTIEEIVQCPSCKIHLHQKEFLTRHMVRCWERNGRKCNLPTPANRVAQVIVRKTRQQQIYKYQRCKYRTKFKENLNKHTNQHNKVKTFKCAICSRRFKTKGSLRLHVENTHVHVGVQEDPERFISDSKNSRIKTEASRTPVDEKRLKCSQCDFRARYKCILKRHTKTKHLNEFDYKCASCKYETNWKKRLEYHTRRHNKDFDLSCSLCDYKTNNRYVLKCHVKRKHLQEFKHKCQLCAYKTDVKAHLERHIRATHLRVSNYKCQSCTYKTCTKSNLEMHIKTKHLKDFDYKCGLCEYKTNRKDYLERHIKAKHLDEFDYKCESCTFKSNIKSALEVHIKTKHLKKFDYKCELCDYKTNFKDLFQLHVKGKHLKQFDYKYDKCDYKSHWKKNLDEHVRTVHLKERVYDYKCDSCGYGANRKTDLERHIKTIHIKEFDYKCDWCEFRTNRKHYFKRHMKAKHFDEFKYKFDV